MEPLKRRGFLRASLGGVAWLAAAQLAAASDPRRPSPRDPRHGKALIVLWLGGGPSQLETFDPKPGAPVGGPTRAIPTAAPGISIAAGLPLLAARMADVSLVRSVVSKEGDHERGTFLLKTGQSPSPAVAHPALGAICASEAPRPGELPSYVSILGGDTLGSDRASRGGYLGEVFDAFRVGDPRDRIADVESPVDEPRRLRRLEDAAIIEQSTAARAALGHTQRAFREQTDRALSLMASPDLAAFRVDDEPARVRQAYGETPFGRGCLAARRLVEIGVRCVEVALSGWDTHVDNFAATAEKTAELDPAFAALLADLRERDLLGSTVVLCTGEFGRTPIINPAGGRDHWTQGFSLALAGGGIRGGQVIGETSPEGAPEPRDPRSVADVHATILTAMGVDPQKVIDTPIGRPVRLSDGTPMKQLLA
jgi:Protein of unknown function (DUF1501)